MLKHRMGASAVPGFVISLLFAACSSDDGGDGEPDPVATGGASLGGSSGAGGQPPSNSGGAAAGTGGALVSSGGSSGSPATGGTPTDVPCNPADKGPDATVVSYPGRGAKPSGTFTVVVETDPGRTGQTIYRPDPIGGIPHPIVTWGNGGCSKDSLGFSELLLEFASHGFVVIADGTPGGGSGSGGLTGDATVFIQSIDWAVAENERACSKYYHKLDTTKIAVAGQSCGGLMALNASGDKRITTSMPMNSGLFSRNQKLYDSLLAPMAIIDGGPDDIAYANGQADFNAINSIPIMFANLPVGHGGTYFSDNAGDFGKLGVAWLRWHLLGDSGATGKGMFIGDSCGLCGSSWTMEWKMKPQ